MQDIRLPTTVQVLNGEPPANTDKVEVNIISGLHYRYSGGGTTVAQQVLVDVLKQPLSENAARKSCDWDSDFLTQIGEARGVQSLN